MVLQVWNSLLRLFQTELKYSERNGTKDLGENGWNKGKTSEIKSRVIHLN